VKNGDIERNRSRERKKRGSIFLFWV